MLRSWRGALRVAARRTSTSRPPLHASSITPSNRHPFVHFRSFSVQVKSHTVALPAANDAADTNTIHESSSLAPTPLLRTFKHFGKPSMSNRSNERTLVAPESTYNDALQAFEYLRDHRGLKERHFLALLEKASVAQQYGAVRTHFTQFSDALAAGQIELYRSSKATWATYQMERLQMHRHVLWAMLQRGSPTSRFRTMQRHFRKHELATKRNQLDLYESDSLNFLLRMECTFTYVDPLARDQGTESWLARIDAILEEMRTLRFRTNYSSSHALFHFLMHRPDVAIVEDASSELAQANQVKPTVESAEDQAIHGILNKLFDKFPRTLERDPRRMSLAVSTAASAGRIGLAVGVLRDADARGIAVDAASFAHVVAMAKDEDTRLAIADLYMRAKDQDRIYESEDNHSMKASLLLYAIHDGNFTQIMELLHEMEYSRTSAPPRVVAVLFASIAKYRAKIRHKYRNKEPRELEAALTACPSVLQLMKNFPSVIDRSTHTGSQAILQALRSGDIDVALAVLRTSVQVTKAPLRPEVFSQVLYAVLATDASSKRDVMVVREVEKLFDAQHPGKRDHLNAQLLNLCESNNDLETMVAVLDNWHANPTQSLSKRALQRVFDVISSHLKAIRKLERARAAEDDDDEGEGDVRYKLGNLELSFRGVLEKYPMLVQLDEATLGAALMRSATSKLIDDVAVLLSVAHSKQLPIQPVVSKAALDVLREAADADPNSPASTVLRESVSAMEADGSWSRLNEQFPDFAARIREWSGYM